MNIKTLLQATTQQLSSTSDSPKLDAEILLIHFCRISKTDIFSQPEQEIDKKSIEKFTQAAERRAQGEPIAYILGEQGFWKLDFFVDENVLIPRPETELIVEWALQHMPIKKSISCLELGVGSGCITISIAHERSDWKFLASDISEQALKVAKKNADRHNMSNIEFVLSDWFDNIPKQMFDIIISNPPYIDREDPHLAALQYEPQSALQSDQHGLADLEKIIHTARGYLKDDGVLLIEHGFDQQDAVQEFLKNSGFNDIQTLKDIQGHPRVTKGINSY